MTSLFPQVLHNGVKRMREEISCRKPVHMWWVWRSASVQMRLAEMRWLHRGRDIDNWGLQAMLRPVESILGQVEYKCRLCLELSWNGKAFCLERGSWRLNTRNVSELHSNYWVTGQLVTMTKSVTKDTFLNIWSLMLQGIFLLDRELWSPDTDTVIAISWYRSFLIQLRIHNIANVL